MGFARGLVVTSETALVSYKCSNPYAPEHEWSVLWNALEVGIGWPVRYPVLSPQDAAPPLLREIPEAHLFSGHAVTTKSVMKIAVWHNLPSGGGKRALYDHVKGLVERGHTVEAWCLSTADRDYLPLADLVPERVVPLDQPVDSPRTVVERLSRRYERLRGRPLRAMHAACRTSARQIEARGFDAVLASSCALYAMPFLARYLRLPSLVYLQEPFRSFYEARPMLPWVGMTEQGTAGLHRRLLRAGTEWGNLLLFRRQAREEWWNARAFSTILVNSYYSRESVLRAYGCDARVCYLGIDTDLFRPLGLRRERFVVGLGSFHGIKGIDLAIESVARLPKPHPPLVWISNSGDSAYLREMARLAEARGVDLRVRMRITDAELVETLNRAALLVYTSHLEPFGLAPLEANACGTPVVAVAEGGIRETIRDGINGFLVDPEPQAVAGAMERILSSPTLSRQMGERAAAYVRNEWSIEQSVARLEALLCVTIEKSRQGDLSAPLLQAQH